SPRHLPSFPTRRSSDLPTATIMAFADILLDTLAAIGDAIALPKTSPDTTYQCISFSMVTKVKELIKAIKNLLNFTVPKEYLAFRSEEHTSELQSRENLV